MEPPDKLIIDGKEYRDELSFKSFQKKERKAKAIILKIEKKQKDELFSSVPTPYLYCCNFGAGSGINQEKVIQFFKKLDGFLRIESEKSKPWVTLVFDSSENASKVMFYHGKYSVEDFDRYFILFYSKSLPVSQTEIIPNGLVFIPNFVSEEEEKSLMNDILNSEGEWEVLQLRTVKHWGYKYDYKTKLISPNSVPPIPQFFQKMIDRIVDEKILPFAPDQITVNMYQPGDGIPSHIETHSVFDDGVVSLSLESQIILEMKHPDSTLANIVLTPRSLLILKGESRYLWTHGISSRKTDLVNGVLVERGHRISITFRKVKIGIPCTCSYYAQCDSMLFDFAERSEKRENSRIEENYVKDVYDSIATHFSDTRHTAWPNIQKFLNDLPNDSLVCDVGCGNGKYFNSNPNITLIGNDQSIPLLEIAKTKGRDVFACNILTLPIKDNTFDCVISIAVIHHLSTEKHRLRALQEIVRILKPGGKMLIYVWAMEQEKRKFGQQDVMVPWNMDEKRIDKLIEEKGNSESGIKIKSLVEQALKKENYVIFQRYYHVFRQGELTYLLKQIPGLEVFPEVYDQDNWTAVAIVHKK